MLRATTTLPGGRTFELRQLNDNVIELDSQELANFVRVTAPGGGETDTGIEVRTGGSGHVHVKIIGPAGVVFEATY